MLGEAKIEKLVGSLGSTNSSHAEPTEKIGKQAEYFAWNAERMPYPEFRRQHLFVGSGVIEAGCKTLIGLTARGRACSERCVVSMPFCACGAVTLTTG